MFFECAQIPLLQPAGVAQCARVGQKLTQKKYIKYGFSFNFQSPKTKFWLCLHQDIKSDFILYFSCLKWKFWTFWGIYWQFQKLSSHIHTSKYSKLISFSDNKKILLTTRIVLLWSKNEKRGFWKNLKYIKFLLDNYQIQNLGHPSPRIIMLLRFLCCKKMSDMQCITGHSTITWTEVCHFLTPTPLA